MTINLLASGYHFVALHVETSDVIGPIVIVLIKEVVQCRPGGRFTRHLLPFPDNFPCHRPRISVSMDLARETNTHELAYERL